MNNFKSEFKINCHQEEILPTITRLKKEFEKINHNIQDLNFRVEMAAREMLANAIKHGCQSEEEIIEIKLKISPSKITLKVIDPGNGFDWKNADFTISLFEGKGIGLGMINQATDK
ncbi:MAG: ATP-binding protein, partial [bacterium]